MGVDLTSFLNFLLFSCFYFSEASVQVDREDNIPSNDFILGGNVPCGELYIIISTGSFFGRIMLTIDIYNQLLRCGLLRQKFYSI